MGVERCLLRLFFSFVQINSVFLQRLILFFMVNRLFLVALLGAALASCQMGSEYKRLCDVESYISTKPDSALAVIRSIDTLSLHTNAARAK